MFLHLVQLGGGITVSGNGYATYKVLDQYGNDITTSALAQGITLDMRNRNCYIK